MASALCSLQLWRYLTINQFLCISFFSKRACLFYFYPFCYGSLYLILINYRPTFICNWVIAFACFSVFFFISFWSRASARLSWPHLAFQSVLYVIVSYTAVPCFICHREVCVPVWQARCVQQQPCVIMASLFPSSLVKKSVKCDVTSVR